MQMYDFFFSLGNFYGNNFAAFPKRTGRLLKKAHPFPLFWFPIVLFLKLLLHPYLIYNHFLIMIVFSAIHIKQICMESEGFVCG